MTTVRVLPDNMAIDVPDGMTLFDAAVRLGITWPSNCNGEARCTACRVHVVAGGSDLTDPEEEEAATLERLDRYARPAAVAGPRRLACRLRPVSDLTVLLQSPLNARDSSDNPHSYVDKKES